LVTPTASVEAFQPSPIPLGPLVAVRLVGAVGGVVSCGGGLPIGAFMSAWISDDESARL
jgi:hypothetical protein